jgi:hypothetical protein
LYIPTSLHSFTLHFSETFVYTYESTQLHIAFLRNTCIYLRVYTASHCISPKRLYLPTSLHSVTLHFSVTFVYTYESTQRHIAFLRNTCIYLRVYTASHCISPKRLYLPTSLHSVTLHFSVTFVYTYESTQRHIAFLRNAFIYLRVYTASHCISPKHLYIPTSLHSVTLHFSETLVSTYKSTQRQIAFLRNTCIYLRVYTASHYSSPKHLYIPTSLHSVKLHFSETLVSTYESTQRHIAFLPNTCIYTYESTQPHNQEEKQYHLRRENFKYHITKLCTRTCGLKSRPEHA